MFVYLIDDVTRNLQ